MSKHGKSLLHPVHPDPERGETMMRNVLIGLVVALSATCTTEPDQLWLEGWWDGRFDYAGESCVWRVRVLEDDRYLPGPFLGTFTVLALAEEDGSADVTGTVKGRYEPPGVTLNFVLDLPPSPMDCQYLGDRIAGQRIEGRLSCSRADTTVVDQDVVLRGINGIQ